MAIKYLSVINIFANASDLQHDYCRLAKKHKMKSKIYPCICLLLFLSTICGAQPENISIEKLSPFLLQKINTDSLSKQKTSYKLVIKSNIANYYPATDTTSYIECSFVNKSANSIFIDATIFENFTLFTCNHRWPLHLWKFETSALKNSSYELSPNEELIIFRTSLKNLCFSNNYMWDWTGHPAPPKSPIWVSFSKKEEYLDKTCLYFAYNIDGVIVLSNILKLKIKE